VRTPGELATGALPGARNIPVNALARRLEEIGPRTRPVVVYCATGARSAYAARQLRQAGFESVFDLGPIRNGYRLLNAEERAR